MDDRDEMYDAVDDEYEDAKRAEQLSHRMKRVAYPPRLMVDFTSLGMEALKRYAQFYNVPVRDELEKDEVAALVARHFDGALEVEEDDSIVSFIQRVRNGERNNANKRSAASDRDRKLADKKRKKSNSRKRQRDASTAHSNASSASNGSAASGGTSNNSSVRDSSTGASTNHADDRKAAAAASASASTTTSVMGSTGSASGASSSSASSNAPSKGHKKSSNSDASTSKKKDKTSAAGNGEDNELYCICNLPSYGNMIACDGKKCPNPSQWYHLECVGFSDGRHPDTWLCPECDPKGFAAFQSSKHKSKKSGGGGGHKQRSKSPASAK